MQYTFVTKFLPVDFEGTLYNSVGDDIQTGRTTSSDYWDAPPWLSEKQKKCP